MSDLSERGVPDGRGERIAVAMSGGVDSAVAALRLVQDGYQVVGFFLRNGVEARGKGSERSCCSVSDAMDARRVAHKLGIPFHTLDVKEPFERIIGQFVDAYREGRTPNPCVGCNVEVKFGRLLELAGRIGAHRVATGHYARVRKQGNRFALSCGLDREKDQSYVLGTLRQDQLSRAVFPLGEMTKSEVRTLAREHKLVVAEKPESQEICFVPTGDYRDLLRERDPALFEQKGDVVTTDGEVVARHDGIAGFTVGQRKGLGAAVGHRQHVVRVIPEEHRVVVGSREEASSAEFTMVNCGWGLIDEPEDSRPLEVMVRVRHRHQAVPAHAWRSAEGQIQVRFMKPEFAVTPGQTAVLYLGEDVMAAGTIDQIFQEKRRCASSRS